MDENVIFTKKDAPSQDTPVTSPPGQPASTPPPGSPREEPSPAVPVTSQPVTQVGNEGGSVPPPASPPPRPSRSSFLSKKTLLVVLGLVLFLGFSFFIFRFASGFLTKGEKEEVTLTYWGLWEDENVMRSVLSDFEKANPHIKVNYSKKDIKQYRQSVVTQINNGTGPDLFRYHNSWTPLLQNNLLPLTSDVITPDEFKTLYFPVIQRDLVQNGALWGIPLGMDTVALFVNTELFQAAGAPVPQTWNDFIRVAKELTVKDSNGQIRTSGAALGTFDNITHAPDVVSVLLAQNGVNFLQFPSTLTQTKEALQFYTNFSQGEDSVWDETLDPSRIAFAKGNLAMYFGYSWDIFLIQELNPQLAFTTHQVPSLPGRSMSVASYWVEGVSSKTKHPEEAMLLMAYLAKKETAQKFYQESAKVRLFGEPYARRDLAETLVSNTLVYPFVVQAETAVSTYFASDTYDDGLNNPLNAYLGNAVRAMRGNTSSDTAVKTLSEGVTQVLDRYGLQ